MMDLDFRIFPMRRVKHIKQVEMADCGLACLGMVSGFHGFQVDLAELRRAAPTASRGITFKGLIAAAERIGLSARAVSVDLPNLHLLRLPAILHWDMSHFVVVERISGKRALIHDPAIGSKWINWNALSAHMTGVALELEPTASFERGDVRRRVHLLNLWTGVRGLKSAILTAVFLSLVAQAFALAAPYYLQLAVDRVVPQMNLSLMSVMAIAFGGLTILNAITLILRQSILLASGSSFGYGLSSNVARHLFRLPIAWFSRRGVGDVLSRFHSIVPIRKTLAEDAPAAIIDGGMAVLTLSLMAFYSPLMSLLAVSALLAIALTRALTFSSQRIAQEEAIAAAALEQSALIETVQNIQALRLAGRESDRHGGWQRRMVDQINGEIRSQRIVNWQNTLQTCLFGLENVISVWIAVSLILKGEFSLGMLFAFLAYKMQFLNAGASLLAKGYDFRMLKLHLERLSDIVLEEQDVSFSDCRDTDRDLIGRVEFKNVYFRYGEYEPYVLSGVNLIVSPGSFVAITGASGGGKSTLLLLLLGLIKPTRGEVLIDGHPLEVFGHKSFYRQVAAVLQDDRLLAGTLAENISMFDDDQNMDNVTSSATAAAIHDDIMAMPMKYNTMVGEMGASLSGGQRQRVLLARALYRSPRLIILDEGTSHLDHANEAAVNRSVSKLGVTRIIVAHREETIASAEIRFALENGKLSELE